MARWSPTAIGPFMDVDTIFYAGEAFFLRQVKVLHGDIYTNNKPE